MRGQLERRTPELPSCMNFEANTCGIKGPEHTATDPKKVSGLLRRFLPGLSNREQIFVFLSARMYPYTARAGDIGRDARLGRTISLLSPVSSHLDPGNRASIAS